MKSKGNSTIIRINVTRVFSIQCKVVNIFERCVDIKHYIDGKTFTANTTYIFRCEEVLIENEINISILITEI